MKCDRCKKKGYQIAYIVKINDEERVVCLSCYSEMQENGEVKGHDYIRDAYIDAAKAGEKGITIGIQLTFEDKDNGI